MPKNINTARIILKVVGWVNIVLGITLFLMFLFSSFLARSSPNIPQDSNIINIISLIVGGVGLLIAIIFAGFGIVCLLTAKGVEEKKNWAKILGIFIGIIYLTNLPVGTILGIFILIGLMSKEANFWFEK